MLCAAGRRVPQLGMVAFQAREIGRWTRAALGGARSDGASTATRDASGCACGAGAELERGQGAVREEKSPGCLRAGLKSIQRDDPRQSKGSSLRLQAGCGSGATPVWGQPYAKIAY